MSHKILSLDGGGVRVIVEATLIERIQRILGADFLGHVDLFAGTSSGGILALCLASGMKIEEAIDFFNKEVARVFAKKDHRKAVFGSKYDNEVLKDVLTRKFGKKTLEDLPRKVFVTGFQLDNFSKNGSPLRDAEDDNERRGIPRFFHNLPGSDTLDELVVDVAMRTSAAPTYFPIYKGYIDGGVSANNPALCATTAVLSGGVPLNQITVLSLSSGRAGMYINQSKQGKGDWGLLKWAAKLVHLLLDAGPELVDYHCKVLLSNRYHRVDPPLDHKIALDEPDEIPELIQVATRFDLRRTFAWLNDHWHTQCLVHPANVTSCPSLHRDEPAMPPVSGAPAQ